ncbi:ATP-binding cassette domain-containing protein [Kribbella solani]|uniref:Simple sugar transport system ATP-binding protein n=1 Tax=Kribbella solani TaxID=236067 RepID=A0A841DN36_9ACTN|nr:ATP-binding cassette domain-containing protein [Kribbella solani]MBB5979952.1 simple sugar transport system ATP-binding protein [Kribbella solani]MDX2968123.1 ATP-binding cassette domain-containing protein [Kribbella solani]
MSLPEQPILELRDVCKWFGTVRALDGVSIAIHPGEVHCLLGDNGAGKSTLIKILSGVHKPSQGEFRVDGVPTTFDSPRDAMAKGVSTVFQDLSMIPLMSIGRNFFLGREPMKGHGPLKRIDMRTMNDIAHAELARIGIQVRDVGQLVGTLSGGERQSVAIARAVHFGARVLILDEPTSALGVKEAGVVLRYIAQARDRGVAVVFITHNAHHAFPVGDRFTILTRGQSYGTVAKHETTREDVLNKMAGGDDLAELDHEIAEFARTDESST